MRCWQKVAGCNRTPPWHNASMPKRKDENEIALVTANFGGIDAVKPLPAHEGIDAFYYIDQPNADSASAEATKTWTRVIVPNYPRHDFNPRLRARYFKHQIHRLDEVREHRWLVWADGSLQFKDLRFLSERVGSGAAPNSRASAPGSASRPCDDH